MSDAGVFESRNSYQPWDLPDLMDKLVAGTGKNDIEANVEGEGDPTYDNGYSEGYEKGIAETRAYYEKLMAENSDSINSAKRSLTRAKDELDKNTIAEMAQLSALVAEQVVKTELALKPELIAHVISDLVAQLPVNEDAINIALHPEDLRSINGMHGTGAEDAFDRCKFVEDESLQRGDCRLSTKDSVLNAQLHDRITGMIDSSLHELLG